MYKYRYQQGYEYDNSLYNQLFRQWEKRMNSPDILSSLFDPEYFKAPIKPCKPLDPSALKAPSLRLDLDLATETSKAGKAFLKIGTATKSDEKLFVRQGYLSTTNDVLERDINNIGHVFGRLGQGVDTY